MKIMLYALLAAAATLTTASPLLPGPAALAAPTIEVANSALVKRDASTKESNMDFLCPVNNNPLCCASVVGLDGDNLRGLECQIGFSVDPIPTNWFQLAESCAGQGKTGLCCEGFMLATGLGCQYATSFANEAAHLIAAEHHASNAETIDDTEASVATFARDIDAEQQGICPMYESEVCCYSSTGGILGNDCDYAYPSPKTAADFKEICAKDKKVPLCCLAMLGPAGAVCEPTQDSTVAAIEPAAIAERDDFYCSRTDTPKCCAFSVLELIATSCEDAEPFPQSRKEFEATCKKLNKKPQCCEFDAPASDGTCFNV